MYIYQQYFVYRKYCYIFRCTNIVFRGSFPSTVLKLQKIIKGYKLNKINILKCSRDQIQSIKCCELSSYKYGIWKFFIWWLYIHSGLPCTCIVLYCGRVPAANAHGCTVAEGLLYKPWSLVVPTCTARCFHQRP